MDIFCCSVMAFIVGLPVVQIVLFCYSIGRPLVGLHLAVVNNELANYSDPCTFNSSCNFENLSCRYLSILSKYDIVKVPFPDEADAKEAVNRGHAWAALSFPKNYSESLHLRLQDGKDASNATIEFSNLNVWMDASGTFNS